MYPALLSISLGLFIGDVLHHWLFDWAFWIDTWIFLVINIIVLSLMWRNADKDDMYNQLK